MSRPTSRLEKIVRVRDRELTRAKSELAVQLRGRNQADLECERKRGQVANGARLLEERLHAGTTGAAMQLTAGAIDATRVGVQVAAEQRDSYEEPIARSRAAVTEARKRLRALEILNERVQAEARLRLARHRQRDLDEIASRIAHAREAQK